MVADTKEIVNEFTNYGKPFVSGYYGCRWHTLWSRASAEVPGVLAEMNEKLKEPYTVEEITQALLGMHPGKTRWIFNVILSKVLACA